MRQLPTRLRAALAAMWAAQQPPSYAVIYDRWDGAEPGCGDVSEEFYETFSSPQEAASMFREAFPHPRSVDNPRLVLILGGIDDYVR